MSLECSGVGGRMGGCGFGKGDAGECTVGYADCLEVGMMRGDVERCTETDKLHRGIQFEHIAEHCQKAHNFVAQ